MTENNLLDVMVHPTRMRIMMTLSGSPGLTPLQIAEALPDVPQASLYRHINRLVEGNVLTIVEERRVRGTTEKVYALNTASKTHLTGEDVAALSKDEHMHYFNSFLVTLMDEFSTYLRQTPNVDLAADGVGYAQVILHMSDADLAEFAAKFNQMLLPYLTEKTDPDGQPRRKRIFSTVFMPAAATNTEKEMK
jgi:DNA-binding transcriptional ArsR family regulator